MNLLQPPERGTIHVAAPSLLGMGGLHGVGLPGMGFGSHSSLPQRSPFAIQELLGLASSQEVSQNTESPHAQQSTASPRSAALHHQHALNALTAYGLGSISQAQLAAMTDPISSAARGMYFGHSAFLHHAAAAAHQNSVPSSSAPPVSMFGLDQLRNGGEANPGM